MQINEITEAPTENIPVLYISGIKEKKENGTSRRRRRAGTAGTNFTESESTGLRHQQEIETILLCPTRGLETMEESIRSCG